MRKLGLVFLLCGLLFVIPAVTQASLLGSLSGEGLFVQTTGINGDWWTFNGVVTVDSSLQGIFGTTATFYASGLAADAEGAWSLSGDYGTLSGTSGYWTGGPPVGTPITPPHWMSTFYLEEASFDGGYSIEMPSEVYFAGPYWVDETYLDLEDFFAYVTPFHFGPGELSTEMDIVPIPGAVWLLGSGLIGMVGLRRMRTS